MPLGRFCLILILFVGSLWSAIYHYGTSWRGVAFPIMGMLLCLVVATLHFMNSFWDSFDFRGTGIRRGVLNSTPREKGYFWAGRSLSFKEACQHFLVVGATGAGKSIMLNLLMQSVITKFGQAEEPGDPVPRRRMVVYDCKADLVSVIGGLAGGLDQVKIMHPLDQRVTPWKVSADITTDADADEFAALLIPKNERDSSPYFADTARALVAGVIKRFIATSSSWTLRDVILAFQTKARLRHVLNHPHTDYLLDHFEDANAKNFAGVKSTLDTQLGTFRTIAALLDASKAPPISLNDWAQNGEGVLVLGNHELAREATDTLNRIVLHHLSKVLIARDGVVTNDQTWIFLDELREAGALKGLRQLLLRGRSKAVSVAMGFQDVQGIYAAYGEHEGAEIVGAAQNMVILHINPSAPTTAKWASEVFSSRRAPETSKSRSVGESNSSFGEQESAQLVPNVYPIQFVELPMPSTESDIEFFSFTNVDGYRAFRYPWQDFIEKEGYFKASDDKKYPDFQLQKDRKCYQLRAWDEQTDYPRLGMSVEPQSKARLGEAPPQNPMDLIDKRKSQRAEHFASEH